MNYVSWLPTAYEVAARFRPSTRGRSNVYLILLDYSDRRGDSHGVYVGMSRYSPAALRSAALTRVCQPLPPALKCSITSGSSMMVTRRLRYRSGRRGLPPSLRKAARSASFPFKPAARPPQPGVTP